MFRRFIFLVASLLATTPAWGLVLTSPLPGIQLSSELKTWLGPLELNIEETCLKPDFCGQDPSHAISPIIPVRTSASQDLFLSFSLENNSSESVTIYLIDHWVLNTKLSLVQFVGSQRSFFQYERFGSQPSTLPTRSVLGLQLTVPPGKSDYLVKIAGLSFHKAILKVWDPESFHRYSTHEVLLTSIMNTAIFWVTFLTTCSWLVTRLRIFFWIPPALTLVLLGELSFRGYYLDLFNLLRIQLPLSPYPFAFIAYPLGGICLIQLVRTNLNAEKLGTAYNHYLNFLQALILALAVGFVSFDMLRVPALTIALLIIPLAIYGLCFKSYQAHRRKVIFILLGFSPVVLGFLVPLLLIFDFYDTNLFVSTSVLVCINIISITFAFAMAELMRGEMQVFLKSLMAQESHRLSLEAARSVQQSLLPRATAPGYQISSFYRPAEVVGGDAFYYQKIGDRLFCSIIDVTGHGLSSAIVTGTIIGAMRVYFQNPARAEDSSEHLITALVRHLNKMIVESSEIENGSSHYVMMMNMVVDFKAGQVTYACSGLSPAFLLNETTVTALFTSGSPLGFSAEPIIQCKSAAISLKSKIFCFTDGLIENPGANGKPMRDRELKNFLNSVKDAPAELLAKNLTELINQRMGRQAIEDDMTFLVIEHEHPAEPNPKRLPHSA